MSLRRPVFFAVLLALAACASPAAAQNDDLGAYLGGLFAPQTGRGEQVASNNGWRGGYASGRYAPAPSVQQNAGGGCVSFSCANFIILGVGY